jgi:hypothetical protein
MGLTMPSTGTTHDAYLSARKTSPARRVAAETGGGAGHKNNFRSASLMIL